MDAFHIRRLRDRVIYYDVRASCWRPLVKTTATRSSAEDWAASGATTGTGSSADATSHSHRTAACWRHCVEIRSYYRTVLYPSGFGCRGRSVHGAAARASAVAAPRFRRRRAGCRPVAKRSRTVRGDVRPVARQIEYCRRSSRVARVACAVGERGGRCGGPGGGARRAGGRPVSYVAGAGWRWRGTGRNARATPTAPHDASEPGRTAPTIPPDPPTVNKFPFEFFFNFI